MEQHSPLYPQSFLHVISQSTTPPSTTAIRPLRLLLTMGVQCICLMYTTQISTTATLVTAVLFILHTIPYFTPTTEAQLQLLIIQARLPSSDAGFIIAALDHTEVHVTCIRGELVPHQRSSASVTSPVVDHQPHTPTQPRFRIRMEL